jgi:3' terminal RNA ribose 2'-O-methyltransferase Hen1
MLLTISTTDEPATDIGYLLRKAPARHQEFEVFGGIAHVFYPEATASRCTVALLLEVDPIGLVRRGGRGNRVPTGGGIDQYVNDRPYAATSLLSVAIGKVFSSARTGKSTERPELAEKEIPLEIGISSLPSVGGADLIRGIFEPLGYEVIVDEQLLDPSFPRWGESRYHSVDLRATKRLSDALTHLTVLIPALDGEKHYWIGDDEVQKLLDRGGDWLRSHPQVELITRGYLGDRRTLTRDALRRLSDEDDVDPDERETRSEAIESTLERPLRLNERRIDAVLEALVEVGAARVADLGCGEGRLLERLLSDGRYTSILGMDVSMRALERAATRLHIDSMAPRMRERISLVQGALTYRDRRLEGWDAAVASEVIEHLDVDRLDAFARTIFGDARPGAVIVSTPNAEYNALFTSLPGGQFRHPDHRFEWSRGEFEDWASTICSTYGYTVSFRPVGDESAELGAPTQMAVFVQ